MSKKNVFLSLDDESDIPKKAPIKKPKATQETKPQQKSTQKKTENPNQKKPQQQNKGPQQNQNRQNQSAGDQTQRQPNPKYQNQNNRPYQNQNNRPYQNQNNRPYRSDYEQGQRRNDGSSYRRDYNRDGQNNENNNEVQQFDENGKPIFRRDYQRNNNNYGGYGGRGRGRGREYDRISGTGRGREIPKDGAGKGNWGSTKDVTTEIEQPGPNQQPVEGAVETEQTEAAVEAPKDDTKTYEQYQAELNANKKGGLFEEKKVRAVETPQGLTKLEIKEEDIKLGEQKKKDKKKRDNANVVPVSSDLLKIQTKPSTRMEKSFKQKPKNTKVSDMDFPPLK